MNLSDFILTLNCVIKSKWVLNLIWQAYYNLLKICFLNAYCRLNENQSKLDVSLQPSRFKIHSLMVFQFEEFLTDNLKTYGFMDPVNFLKISSLCKRLLPVIKRNNSNLKHFI